MIGLNKDEQLFKANIFRMKKGVPHPALDEVVVCNCDESDESPRFGSASRPPQLPVMQWLDGDRCGFTLVLASTTAAAKFEFGKVWVCSRAEIPADSLPVTGSKASKRLQTHSTCNFGGEGSVVNSL